MATDPAPDFFDAWEASAQLSGFLKLMDAAANRRDEEASHIMIAQAFANHRDVWEVVLPARFTQGLAGEVIITWGSMYLNPEDQERIYL